jgi:hypothetical protein
MSTPKVNATALQNFSHGNVDAIQGRTYAMNKADAEALKKEGFVTLEAQGDPEKTQNDETPQVKNVGDVVVDTADDILGDGDTKADKDLDNKAAPTTANKARATTTHKK